MNDNKILLQAIIDADSIKPADIAKIQKTLDRYPLKLTADFNKEQLLAELKKAVPEIQTELKKIKDIEIQMNIDMKDSSSKTRALTSFSDTITDITKKLGNLTALGAVWGLDLGLKNIGRDKMLPLIHICLL